MTIVSKENPLRHYHWGERCEAWNLVDDPQLSVKLEQIPAGSAEQLHYHEISQQLFFILKGTATIIVEDNIFTVVEQEGLKIEAGKPHSIGNKQQVPLQFILCSQPSTVNDRINL